MQVKIIPGYTNYTIAEGGTITNIKTGNISKKNTTKREYYFASLKSDKDGEFKTVPLHRLLMMVFKPVEGMDKLVVDHIDCNKTNNSLNNLEWVTSKENTHRAIKNGCYKNGRQVISDETVIAIRKEYIPGKNGNFRQLLQKYNLKKSMFYYIINGDFRKDLTPTKDLNDSIDKIKKNHCLDYEKTEELKIMLEKRRNKEIKITKVELAKQFKISPCTIGNYEKRLFPSD